MWRPVLTLLFAAVVFLATAASADEGDVSTMPVASLLQRVNGADPGPRLDATRELFHRGPSILADLKQAGAAPMRTVSPPRGDVVYSLLQGRVDGGGVASDSFGLRVDPTVTAADIRRVGQRYGFALLAGSSFDPSAVPACYVRLLPGHDLVETLKAILSGEAGVVSINLNTIER